MQFCLLVSRGEVDTIKEQLSSYPELAESRDADGSPALLIAVLGGRPIITRLLVEPGADPIATPSGTDSNIDADTTPLAASLRSDRPYITRLLVECYMRREFFDGPATPDSPIA